MFSKGFFHRVAKSRDCVVKCQLYTNQSKALSNFQMTNFRLFQTERVCKRQFHTCSKWQKVLQMCRKHCGKRRNCSLRAISPFPTVFSKDFYCMHVKTRACLGNFTRQSNQIKLKAFADDKLNVTKMIISVFR